MTKHRSDFRSVTKQVDITSRGREDTLAKWILRRILVEKVRVVEVALPSGGGGRGWDSGEAGKKKGAPKSVARWERVSFSLVCVKSFCRVHRPVEVVGAIRTSLRAECLSSLSIPSL